MAEAFNCPNCGAQVEYTGDQATMTCTFCNSIIQVPKELVRAARHQAEAPADAQSAARWIDPVRDAAADASSAQAAAKWTKWIVIAVIVLFVVPSCIGFGGTILGVIASIFGGIAAILAPFFVSH